MYKDYLSKLTKDSVWELTKQDSSFDNMFKATNLFIHYKKKDDSDDTNLEDYFSIHHDEFGVNTDRHRSLIIAQTFGLITKTSFYTKGSTYDIEDVSNIYNLIKNSKIGERRYNEIKTEQLLKFKIRNICDSTDKNADTNILPILFIYKTLRMLKDNYGIDEISIDNLYTYVMTCKDYKDVDKAVEYLASNPTPSEFVKDYQANSRVLTIIKKNTNLFIFENNTISINPLFDDYFYEEFFLKFDSSYDSSILSDINKYKDFLYNFQDFKINLLDEPVYPDPQDVDEDDADYQKKVNESSTRIISNDEAKTLHTKRPKITVGADNKSKYQRDAQIAKTAISRANYKCVCDDSHYSFTSSSTNKQYMESHHFVPMGFQKRIWDKYGINLDCLQNILSVCPNCHRKFHYATKEEKRQIVEKLFENVKPRFSEIGFNISLEEIFEMYKC